MRFSVAVALGLMGVCALRAQNVLSLAVSEEVTPAGGIAQVKVYMTEPKPIIKAWVDCSMDEFSFPDIYGIAAAGGLTGMARRRNGTFSVALSTATPDQMQADYPILTAAVGTNPNLPPGSVLPVSLQLGTMQFLDANGQRYAVESKAGSVRIGGTHFIGNVLPGGGTVLDKQYFTITGGGFVSGMKVRGEGARIDKVISSQELRMVATKTVQLDGMRLVTDMPNKEQQTYYSYFRAQNKVKSAHPLLAGVVPVFSTKVVRDAAAAMSPSPDVVAVGLQNPTSTPAEILVEALSATGDAVLQRRIVVPGGTQLLQSRDELLGVWPNGAPVMVTLRARSSVPFQMSVAEWVGGSVNVPVVATLVGGTY